MISYEELCTVSATISHRKRQKSAEEKLNTILALLNECDMEPDDGNEVSLETVVARIVGEHVGEAHALLDEAHSRGGLNKICTTPATQNALLRVILGSRALSCYPRLEELLQPLMPSRWNSGCSSTAKIARQLLRKWQNSEEQSAGYHHPKSIDTRATGSSSSVEKPTHHANAESEGGDGAEAEAEVKDDISHLLHILNQPSQWLGSIIVADTALAASPESTEPRPKKPRTSKGNPAPDDPYQAPGAPEVVVVAPSGSLLTQITRPPKSIRGLLSACATLGNHLRRAASQPTILQDEANLHALTDSICKAVNRIADIGPENIFDEASKQGGNPTESELENFAKIVTVLRARCLFCLHLWQAPDLILLSVSERLTGVGSVGTTVLRVVPLQLFLVGGLLMRLRVLPQPPINEKEKANIAPSSRMLVRALEALARHNVGLTARSVFVPALRTWPLHPEFASVSDPTEGRNLAEDYAKMKIQQVRSKALELLLRVSRGVGDSALVDVILKHIFESENTVGKEDSESVSINAKQLLPLQQELHLLDAVLSPLVVANGSGHADVHANHWKKWEDVLQGGSSEHWKKNPLVLQHSEVAVDEELVKGLQALLLASPQLSLHTVRTLAFSVLSVIRNEDSAPSLRQACIALLHFVDAKYRDVMALDSELRVSLQGVLTVSHSATADH